MAALRVLPALAAALLLAAAGQASKYSREANEALAAAGSKRREAGEFRVVRLNQVWEKAQRVSEAARGDGSSRKGPGVGPGRFGHSFPVREMGRSGSLCLRRDRSCPAPARGCGGFRSVLGHGCPRLSRSEGLAQPRAVRLSRRRGTAFSRERGCVSEPWEVLTCPWLNTAAKPPAQEVGERVKPLLCHLRLAPVLGG